jgi:hypothetical protein
MGIDIVAEISKIRERIEEWHKANLRSALKKVKDMGCRANGEKGCAGPTARKDVQGQRRERTKWREAANRSENVVVADTRRSSRTSSSSQR